MASNLPPGCKVCDIPGNRPEDAQREKDQEFLLLNCEDASLNSIEYKWLATKGLQQLLDIRYWIQTELQRVQKGEKE